MGSEGTPPDVVACRGVGFRMVGGGARHQPRFLDLVMVAGCVLPVVSGGVFDPCRAATESGEFGGGGGGSNQLSESDADGERLVAVPGVDGRDVDESTGEQGGDSALTTAPWQKSGVFRATVRVRGRVDGVALIAGSTIQTQRVEGAFDIQYVGDYYETNYAVHYTPISVRSGWVRATARFSTLW